MLHRCRVAITRANLDQIRSPGPDIYDPGTGIPTSSCDDRETDSELVNDGGAVHRSTDAVDTEIWTSDLQGQHVTGDVIPMTDFILRTGRRRGGLTASGVLAGSTCTFNHASQNRTLVSYGRWGWFHRAPRGPEAVARHGQSRAIMGSCQSRITDSRRQSCGRGK